MVVTMNFIPGSQKMHPISTDPIKQFEDERRDAIASYKNDVAWQELSGQWLEAAFRQKYMYNFSWLGRPIIQLPADMIAFQEIVWAVRPDLIIETGIAHGGSLIFSASMLTLLEYSDAIERGSVVNPKKPERRVLGVDIDIRSHNRAAIESHPMAGRIDMIEGSSIAPETVRKVRDAAVGFSRILVCLDSWHTHDHVVAELDAYAPLVSKGSYCIVFDTVVADLPDNAFPGRPWKPGNNPKTAVHAYLDRLNSGQFRGSDGQQLLFGIDRNVEEKLLLNATPDGFLKRL
jgi:cephalosporin hydroxylase